MSEAEKIEIGDVVKLKSGGPELTVTNVGKLWETSDVLHAWCAWFSDDGKNHEGTFPCASLEKINVTGEGELEHND